MASITCPHILWLIAFRLTIRSHTTDHVFLYKPVAAPVELLTSADHTSVVVSETLSGQCPLSVQSQQHVHKFTNITPKGEQIFLLVSFHFRFCL